MNAYLGESGKQVPYDALVVLEPFIGLGSTDEEKAEIVNKMLLIFWADFH